MAFDETKFPSIAELYDNFEFENLSDSISDGKEDELRQLMIIMTMMMVVQIQIVETQVDRQILVLYLELHKVVNLHRNLARAQGEHQKKDILGELKNDVIKF